MPKLYKILWSLAIFFVFVTVITFTFGLILVGAGIISLLGIYRYYLARKRSRSFRGSPKGYFSGEIIDISSEPIPHAINARYLGKEK